MGTSEGQDGSWKVMLPAGIEVSRYGWVLLTSLGAERPVFGGRRSTQGGFVTKSGLFLGEEYEIPSRVANEGEWNAEVEMRSVTISLVMGNEVCGGE